MAPSGEPELLTGAKRLPRQPILTAVLGRGTERPSPSLSPPRLGRKHHCRVSERFSRGCQMGGRGPPGSFWGGALCPIET